MIDTPAGAAAQRDVLGELRRLPTDSAGQLEMWRRSLAKGLQEGRHDLVIAEDLEQEAKLLRFGIDEVDRQVGKKVLRGECDRAAAADLAERLKRGREEQLEKVETEIADLIRDLMYPGFGRLPADAMLPGEPNFAVGWQLFEELGKRAFADKGFLEEPEIMVKALARVGLTGLAKLVFVARKGGVASKYDMSLATNLCALITAEEERETPSAGCYNRLRPRRGAHGQMVIVIDQVGNPDYVAPYVAPPQSSFSRSRFGARARDSHGKSVRRRGSRRLATSRSSGSDDPDPEPERASRPGHLGASQLTRTSLAGVER